MTETFPANLYFSPRPEVQELHQVITNSWGVLSGWSEDQVATFADAGYYSQLVSPRLRILGWNSNYGYGDNWYNILNQDQPELERMKQFVENTLASAKDNDEKVAMNATHHELTRIRASRRKTNTNEKLPDMVAFLEPNMETTCLGNRCDAPPRRRLELLCRVGDQHHGSVQQRHNPARLRAHPRRWLQSGKNDCDPKDNESVSQKDNESVSAQLLDLSESLMHVFFSPSIALFQFVDPETGEAQSAELSGPTANTFSNINPGVRLFYMDPETLDLLDYDQYFFYLGNKEDGGYTFQISWNTWPEIVNHNSHKWAKHRTAWKMSHRESTLSAAAADSRKKSPPLVDFVRNTFF